MALVIGWMITGNAFHRSTAIVQIWSEKRELIIITKHLAVLLIFHFNQSIIFKNSTRLHQSVLHSLTLDVVSMFCTQLFVISLSHFLQTKNLKQA